MPRILLATVSVFFLSLVGFAQGVPTVDNPNEVQKLIMASRPLFEEKKYDEAIETLKKALQLQPDNHAVLAMVGSVYLMKGQMDAASEYFGKAIVISPNEFRHHLMKAYSDKFRGAKEDGLVAVRKAIEIDPSKAEAHYLHEELLALGGGSVKERTEALRKAVDLKPDFLEDYKWAAYRKNSIAKDAKGAEEAFKIAIDVDPKKMAGRFELGRMFVDQGRLAEARELWNGRTSDEDRTHPNFILVLKRAEELSAAKAEYEKTPDQPKTLLRLGLATMEGDHWVVDGRQERAIVHFRKALDLKADFVEAQFAICKAYVQVADTYKLKNKELDEELAKLRKMDPNLADEIVEYRKSYKGGFQTVGPPPPAKKP